jgi:hypothetical protein
MDSSVNRCLIEASFSRDAARGLGLASPFGLGDLSKPLFEDYAILLGELFDTLEKLSDGLTHAEDSSRFSLGTVITRWPHHTERWMEKLSRVGTAHPTRRDDLSLACNAQ